MTTEYGDSLGLETAWLDNELDTIVEAKSYLEECNFVVHVSPDADEIETWVLQNGYDVLLTDLRLEGDRMGTDLIKSLVGSEKQIAIFPVSAYLNDFARHLRRIPKAIHERAIDKTALRGEAGFSELRRAILKCVPGKIRVVERCVGFVDREVDGDVEVCVKMPDGSIQKRVFIRDRLYDITVGRPGTYLELVTFERQRGSCLELKTICKWVHECE